LPTWSNSQNQALIDPTFSGGPELAPERKIVAQTSFTLELKTTKLPAFRGEQGYWAQYEALEADGVTDMVLTPHLDVRKINTGPWIVDLQMHFDPEEFPREKYGLPYTDGQLEAEVAKHMDRVFPSSQFGSPRYTEQGMQADGLISMEYGKPFLNGLSNSSAHFKISLLTHPLVENLFYPPDFPFSSLA